MKKTILAALVLVSASVSSAGQLYLMSGDNTLLSEGPVTMAEVNGKTLTVYSNGKTCFSEQSSMMEALEIMDRVTNSDATITCKAVPGSKTTSKYTVNAGSISIVQTKR